MRKIFIAIFAMAVTMPVTIASALIPVLGPADGGSGVKYPAAKFGAICDGASHPLSSITTHAGLDSTGWTLAQWNVYFPWALSLNDEIDGQAWSATFAAAQVGGVAYHATFMGTKGGECLTADVNFTGGVIKNAYLDFIGTRQICSGFHVICQDWTATKFATINAPYVHADCNLGTEPYSGYRFLRYAQGAYTGALTVINPRGDGCYTHATREWGDEVSFIINPLENNQDINGGRTLYLDAQNQFDANATERFYPITVPVNSGNAITQYTQMQGDEVCSTCDGPVYINGGLKPQFLGTYTGNNNPVSGHKFGFIIYMTTVVPLTSPNFDIRSESFISNGLTGEFYITGDDTTPKLYEWKYRTFSDWSCILDGNVPGCGVFVLDPAITSATFANLEFSASIFGANKATTVFPEPAKWSGSGHISVPFQENMPLLGGPFTGTICILLDCKNIVPTESMTLGGENINDATAEHTLLGVTRVGFFGPVADTWRQALNGTTGNALTYQSLSAFGCNGNYYDNTITVANAMTVNTGDSVALFSAIPASSLEQVFWGKGNALPTVWDICLKSSVAGGNLAYDFSNGTGNEHLVHNLVLPLTPNTYQEYIFQLPAWVSPTKFGVGTNAIGLRHGPNFGCRPPYSKFAPSFTASINLFIMDVTDAGNAVITPGSVLSNIGGVTAGTTVVDQISGTTGGVGSYHVSISQIHPGSLIYSTVLQDIVPDTWTDTFGAQPGPSACTSASTSLLGTVGNSVSISFVRAYPGFYAMPFKAKSETTRAYEAMRFGYQKSIPSGVAPDATNGFKNKGLGGAFRFTATAAGSAWISFQTPIAVNNGTFAKVRFYSPLAVSNNCWDLTANADGGLASVALLAGAVPDISDAGVRVTCAGFVVGHEYAVHWDAVAPL